MSATWNTAGQPENLEAAALDALEWLKVLRIHAPAIMSNRACLSLNNAMAALEKQLEKQEAE